MPCTTLVRQCRRSAPWVVFGLLPPAARPLCLRLAGAGRGLTLCRRSAPYGPPLGPCSPARSAIAGRRRGQAPLLANGLEKSCLTSTFRPKGPVPTAQAEGLGFRCMVIPGLKGRFIGASERPFQGRGVGDGRRPRASPWADRGGPWGRTDAGWKSAPPTESVRVSSRR